MPFPFELPVLSLERRHRGPAGLVHVQPVASREGVAAALGDRIDDPAREPAVLGGDPGGEHLRFLDRILDEESVRGAEQIVVDVHAVHQEDVVVGERPVDRHLAAVRRIVRQSRLQLRDPPERPTHRQGVDLRRGDVRAGLGRLERGRDDTHHVDRLDDAGRRHRSVDFDVATQRHGRRLRDVGGPGKLEEDVVASRRQRQDLVVPVHVGHRRAHALQRVGADGHRHDRQDEPLGVEHGAANGAGLASLCQCAGRRRGQRRAQQQDCSRAHAAGGRKVFPRCGTRSITNHRLPRGCFRHQLLLRRPEARPRTGSARRT